VVRKFKIGDTVISDKKEKGIIFMSFSITSMARASDKEKYITEGLWVCSEDFKKILNFSNSPELYLDNENATQYTKKIKRSKILLLEKDMNIALQKDTAKKFSSQLIKFMQQIKK
jgi:hypothetical protein